MMRIFFGVSSPPTKKFSKNEKKARMHAHAPELFKCLNRVNECSKNTLGTGMREALRDAEALVNRIEDGTGN